MPKPTFQQARPKVRRHIDLLNQPAFTILHMIATAGVLITVVWTASQRDAKLSEVSRQLTVVQALLADREYVTPAAERRLSTIEATLAARTQSEQEWRSELRDRLIRIERNVATNSQRIGNGTSQ